MYLRNFIYSTVLGFAALATQAQEQDTLSSATDQLLEEMVITGQYNPQSVNKSIYEVKVINREMIDRLAGNNLADVLNQSLNISIQPNPNTGKSGMKMFGLDASYFKILVDNVPMVNEESFGNSADLTQLNLDDIERVEIVEGAMGVDYGSNAVAGIINIITKKSLNGYKWQITPSLQEETIGNEYNLNTKGRHIQSIKVAHQLLNNVYIDATYSRNDFRGHWNGRKGEHYFINDSLRGYEWLPKLQQTAKGTIAYRGENHTVFFKTEYFNERVNRYNQDVLNNFSPETNTSQPYAFDQEFTTERFFNHLNASGWAKDWFRYDVSVSYQEQTKNLERYKYFIKKDEETDNEKLEYESRKVIYSRGTFSNFTKSKYFDFQVGYEINEIDGYTSPFAGDFNNTPVERKMGSYDAFGSAEINFNDRFSIRPGFRLMFSNFFDSKQAYSVSAKYIFNNDYELRAVYGVSPRLPDYDELYTYFVDVNHTVLGNENLRAEDGRSVFVHLKKRFNLGNGYFTNRLTATYMDVDDKISLFVVKTEPLVNQYINVSTYKYRNISYMGSLKINNWDTNFGITYGANSQQIEPGKFDTGDYLYSVNFNANVSYFFDKTNTTVSLFYKYNGSEYQFVQRTVDVKNYYYEKGKIAPIQWFDATVRQDFLDRKLNLTVGVRNIFDVTRVNSTASASAAHTAASSSLLMGYGRSYFAKLTYNISI